MLLLRESCVPSPCRCRGRGRHLVVVEADVAWPDWVERLASRELVLVVQRGGEPKQCFADRTIARLRDRPPCCALFALGGCDDPETMAARARVGRALVMALAKRSGTLFVVGAPGEQRAATALADVLGAAAPANVRVVALPDIGELRLHAA